MTSAYPLTWPEHIRRSTKREKGQFKATLPAALKNVRESMRLFQPTAKRPSPGW